MKRVECPKCEGAGSVLAVIATGQKAMCSLCGGLGLVTESVAATWAKVRSRSDDDEEE